MRVCDGCNDQLVLKNWYGIQLTSASWQVQRSLAKQLHAMSVKLVNARSTSGDMRVVHGSRWLRDGVTCADTWLLSACVHNPA
jgi:hypothetical protein